MPATIIVNYCNNKNVLLQIWSSSWNNRSARHYYDVVIHRSRCRQQRWRLHVSTNGNHRFQTVFCKRAFAIQGVSVGGSADTYRHLQLQRFWHGGDWLVFWRAVLWMSFYFLHQCSPHILLAKRWLVVVFLYSATGRRHCYWRHRGLLLWRVRQQSSCWICRYVSSRQNQQPNN